MIHLKTEEKISLAQWERKIRELRKFVYEEIISLNEWEILKTEKKFPPAVLPTIGRWEKFNVGGSWGGRFVTTWFRTKINPTSLLKSLYIPPYSAQNSEFGISTNSNLAFYLNISTGNNSEGSLFINRNLVEGIDSLHPFIDITRYFNRGGGKIEILVEAWCERDGKKRMFEGGKIYKVNKKNESAYFSMKFILELLKTLPEEFGIREKIFTLFTEIISKVDVSLPKLELIGEEINKKFKNVFNHPPTGTIWACGHTHIDPAWLWPLDAGIRKSLRTFSRMVSLMDKYPQFHFTQSQPFLTENIKNLAPNLFKKIQEKVKKGQWEAVGSSWVEHDCNIPDGESLIRQILLAKNFVRKELNTTSPVAWFPDSFGYNANLPQIFLKSGIKYFFTTKISWGQYTSFPYNVFFWEGIDGSKILAVQQGFTYNANLIPSEVLKAWQGFKNKHLTSSYILSYGYGDGGGGPTVDMIENGSRIKNIPFLPEVKFGKAEDFFREIEKDSHKFPVFKGELYLEYHRGCYTTQGKTKKGNRDCEVLLHSAECLLALTNVLKKASNSLSSKSGVGFEQWVNKTKEKENIIWKEVLAYQFHDILPGSSVREVYEETEMAYSRLQNELHKIIDDRLEKLRTCLETKKEPVTTSNKSGKTYLIFNPFLSRECILEVDALHKEKTILTNNDFQQIPSQLSSNGKKIIFSLKLPAYGYSVVNVVNKDKMFDNTSINFNDDSSSKIRNSDIVPVFTKLSSCSLKLDETNMENQFFILKIKNGKLTSLFDKSARREVLNGTGNVFKLYLDLPHGNDAWDIDFNFDDVEVDIQGGKTIVVEKGPIKGTLKWQFEEKGLKINQEISIFENLPYITFKTNVDWMKKHKLLKVLFPLDIFTEDVISGIPFGAVKRSNRLNYPHEKGKFEMPANGWINLDEGETYGVAIMSDYKYGFDVRGGNIRISLLRAPDDPDQSADEGNHTFTYILYPHMGSWRKAKVPYHFYSFLYPNFFYSLTSPLSPFSPIDIEGDVILSTMKLEESSTDLIIRLYEPYGERTSAIVKFNFEVKNICECNLVEEKITQFKEFPKGKMQLDFKPFEIRTFLVKMK